jgi:N-acetylglucosaminyl-diphospho-decaprenol L-rhamnosyltransferase
VTRVDVVVVTYNSRQHLRACVEPLCRDSGIEVIVVDNNSQDGTLASVADLPVKAIVRHDNRGFGFACNLGWRAGNGRSVVFLNPDSQTDASSILALADVLEREARVGVLAPQIVDEEGRLQLSQRRFPSLMTSFAAALFVPRIWPTTPWSLDVADARSYLLPGSPNWVSGACLSMRRDVLKAVNGFDERFFMYYEDMDLCRRVRELGYDVRYEPSIRLVHVGGASAPRERLIPVMARSRLLYSRKHNGRRGELFERLSAALHAVTHVLLTTQGKEARRGYLRALAVSVAEHGFDEYAVTAMNDPGNQAWIRDHQAE